MASHHCPLKRRRLPHGFTLIELLVSLVIISILASLSLAGMAGARQRAKIDQTKSTTRKLHETIMPQYERYLRRRVSIPSVITNSKETAADRLTKIRALMVQEMPDQWADVYDGTAASTSTAPVRRYSQYRRNLGPDVIAYPTSISASAECLYMIVTQGGFNADATELFRTAVLPVARLIYASLASAGTLTISGIAHGESKAANPTTLLWTSLVGMTIIQMSGATSGFRSQLNRFT